MESAAADVGASRLVLALVVEIAQRARSVGVGVSVGQLVTLMRALGVRPVATRAELKRLVRLTLATKAEELEILAMVVDSLLPRLARPAAPGLDQGLLQDQLFDALRLGDSSAAAEAGTLAADMNEGWDHSGPGHAARRIMRALDLSELLMRATVAAAPVPSGRLAAVEAQGAYDTFEASLRHELRMRAAADEADVAALVRRMSELSLRTGTRAEQERVRAAIRPLARRLASRSRHRRRGGRHQFDLRRTLARSVGTGGAPVRLYHHRRQARRPTLFVLADVSGSMVDYSTFTLDLLRALTSEIASLRCFAFVDGTAEIPAQILRRPNLLSASLPLIPGVVAGDGHSDYGAALAAFEALAAPALHRRAILIVIGDGRTRTSHPGSFILRRLQRRVGQLLWITPEPESTWGSGDSHLAAYRPCCDRIDQVATLGQLERWVDGAVLAI